jgi:hypothetical protein
MLCVVIGAGQDGFYIEAILPAERKGNALGREGASSIQDAEGSVREKSDIKGSRAYAQSCAVNIDAHFLVPMPMPLRRIRYPLT